MLSGHEERVAGSAFLPKECSSFSAPLTHFHARILPSEAHELPKKDRARLGVQPMGKDVLESSEARG
jgi:hypothetical protein